MEVVRESKIVVVATPFTVSPPFALPLPMVVEELKKLAPEKVLLSPRSVELAAVMVMFPPSESVVLLMVPRTPVK